MGEYLIFTLGEPLPTVAAGGEPDPVVVVVEPGRLPEVAVMEALVAALEIAEAPGFSDPSGGGGDVVVVSARPVTDTLKVVTGNDVVVGTADREHHRFVEAPFVLRLSLLGAVGGAGPAAGVLTTLAGRARLVPVTRE